MADGGQLVAFALAVLAIQAIPGPGMLFLLAQSMSHGPRAGVVASLGSAAAMVIHTVVVAAGLGAVLLHAPAAYHAIRVAGGLYLLLLAIGHLRGSDAAGEAPRDEPSHRRIFARSALNTLANPKVILFFLAFLPQFVRTGGAPAPVQLAVLGGIFLAIGLVLDIAIGLAAGRAGDALRGSRRLRAVLDRVVGTVLGALGVRVLLDSRR